MDAAPFDTVDSPRPGLDIGASDDDASVPAQCDAGFAAAKDDFILGLQNNAPPVDLCRDLRRSSRSEL
jgi:hypothetical protein